MNDVDFSNLSITVVGLGLIGGSFARNIRNNTSIKNLWAVDVDENVLRDAENLKIIDKGFTNPKFPLQNSDIIILCIYPNLTIKFIKDYINDFKHNAIITDTSGIKQKIVEKVNSFIRDDLEFVGGHPMAGKESSGFLNSNGDIFNDAQYIITPSQNSKIKNISILKSLFTKMKFKAINELTPKNHDHIIAYTSHLPHIIACALVNSAANNGIVSCVGGSFRDATRVADINATLWSELLIENKEEILKQVKSFIGDINDIYELIESDNQESLKIYLEKSCENRKRMNV
ncbi:MAG: prephenate dehydrogenase [Oscillospiraceae bacterium]